VNGTVLVFTCVISLGAGILFGMAPALHSARGSLNESLKEGSATTGSRSGDRIRKVLVVSELAQESAALSEVLMMDGYRVAAAATVEQALSFADQVMPDLILLDLSESQTSESLRIGQLLKSDPRTSSILVVALAYVWRKKAIGWG